MAIHPDEIKRVKGLGCLQNKGTDCFNIRVLTVNGKITSQQAKTLAEAAEKFGSGELTFTTRMTVEVKGVHYDNIEPFMAYIGQVGLIAGGTGPLVRPVVSCKGTTCQYGLYDTFSLAEEIHNRFYLGYHSVKLPHKFKIACGGCPNNCVKPDLNDLGIVGQNIPGFDPEKCKGCSKCKIVAACPMGAVQVEDKLLRRDLDICNNCGRCIGKCPFEAVAEGTPGFKIYIGGRWGKKVAQGKPLSKIFTDREEVLNVVESAILLFREQGLPGERFADTINRLGFENVQAQLLSGELLARKENIIAD